MRHSCNPQSIDAKDNLLHEHLGDGSLPRRLWEKRMELPEDIISVHTRYSAAFALVTFLWDRAVKGR